MTEEKFYKKKFIVEYYGTYPPKKENIMNALINGSCDISGILNVIEVNENG